MLKLWLLEKNVTYFEVWEEDDITEYDLCRAVHIFCVLRQKATLLESCVIASVILQQNEYIVSNRWLKCQKHCIISKQFKQDSNPVSYLHRSFLFQLLSLSPWCMISVMGTAHDITTQNHKWHPSKLNLPWRIYISNIFE